MTHKFGPSHVELLALSRTSAAVVTARLRVVNDGSGTIGLASTFVEEINSLPRDPAQEAEPLTASGLGLLDPAANKLYLPLSTDAGECLCSRTSGRELGPKQTTELYAMFPAPPAGVDRMTLMVPLTVPFQNVPLGSGPVGRPPDLRADPTTARLREPRVLSVTGQSEGETESATEDADNRSVRLSSDVLFALNKADLTPQATAVLERVAGQINGSSGSTVKVDGYTDNTGNDAINEPLSRRRAQAVADRLETLVTRSGVEFQVAGHGSADPVASNGDEAGRRKNRRVTVLFTRPRPVATPPVTGTPYRRPDGTAVVLGTAEFPGGEGGSLTAEINGLHRDGTGLTTLVWTVRNSGTAEINLVSEFEIFLKLHDQFGPRRGFSTGGVLLADPAARTRYYPLMAADGRCLCTTLVFEAKSKLGPGESSTYSATYKLPAEAGKVEVWFPWTKGGYTFAKTAALPVR